MSTFKKLTAQDIAIIPFNAHKQYVFDSSSADQNSISISQAKWTSESLHIYSGSVIEDEINFAKYSQIDHLFYRNYKRDTNNKFGDSHYLNQKRELYEKTHIISIPSGLYGHEIKPGTLFISASTEITDDKKGNLIISGTNVNNYPIDIRSNLFRLDPIKGFKKYDLNTYKGHINTKYYRDGIERVNKIFSYSSPDQGEFDDSYFFNPIKYNKVNFSTSSIGFLGSNAHQFPSVTFNSKIGSNIISPDSEKFNFNIEDDFSISFYMQYEAVNDDLEIGDIYEGGIIFAEDANNHYIVSQKILALTTSDTWGALGISIGNVGSGIGEGQTQTQNIIDIQSPNDGFLANKIQGISFENYNDWWLPTQDEFDSIIDNVDPGANSNLFEMAFDMFNSNYNIFPNNSDRSAQQVLTNSSINYATSTEGSSPGPTSATASLFFNNVSNNTPGNGLAPTGGITLISTDTTSKTYLPITSSQQEAAAGATFTFSFNSNEPFDNSFGDALLTLISSDGTSITYRGVKNGLAVQNQFDTLGRLQYATSDGSTGNNNAGTNGTFKATKLKEVIEGNNGHNSKLLVTQDGPTLIVTQAVGGIAGNQIVNLLDSQNNEAGGGYNLMVFTLLKGYITTFNFIVGDITSNEGDYATFQGAVNSLNPNPPSAGYDEFLTQPDAGFIGGNEFELDLISNGSLDGDGNVLFLVDEDFSLIPNEVDMSDLNTIFVQTGLGTPNIGGLFVINGNSVTFDGQNTTGEYIQNITLNDLIEGKLYEASFTLEGFAFDDDGIYQGQGQIGFIGAGLSATDTPPAYQNIDDGDYVFEFTATNSGNGLQPNIYISGGLTGTMSNIIIKRKIILDEVDRATNFIEAINGINGHNSGTTKINAILGDVSGEVKLSQEIPGTAGQTTITNNDTNIIYAQDYQSQLFSNDGNFNTTSGIELINNGDFSDGNTISSADLLGTGSLGYKSNGSAIITSNQGRVFINSNGDSAYIENPTVYTPGQQYEVTFTAKGTAAHDIRVRDEISGLGGLGDGGFITLTTTEEIYSFIFTANSTSATILFARKDSSQVSWNFTIDNISIKEYVSPTTWTLDTGWSLIGSKAVATATPINSNLVQDLSPGDILQDQSYEVTFTISNHGFGATSGHTGRVRLELYGNNNSQDIGIERSADGTYTEIFTPIHTGNIQGNSNKIILRTLAPSGIFPELITNGTFDGGTGWTFSANGWGIQNGVIDGNFIIPSSNGVLSFTGTAYSYAEQTGLNIIAGRIYRITFEKNDIAGNPVVVYLGGNQTGGTDSPHINTTGAQTVDLVAGNTDSNLRFYAGSTGTRWNGTIDNVSVVELPQTNQIGPNLILNGTFDNDSGWTFVSPLAWVISGGQLVGQGGENGYIEILAPDIIEGREFRITYDVVVASTGGQFILANHTTNDSTLNSTGGSNNVDLIGETVIGTYSVDWLQGSSNTGKIKLWNDDTFDGIIDNIIVEELFFMGKIDNISVKTTPQNILVPTPGQSSTSFTPFIGGLNGPLFDDPNKYVRKTLNKLIQTPEKNNILNTVSFAIRKQSKSSSEYDRRYIMAKSTTKTIVPTPLEGRAQILTTRVPGSSQFKDVESQPQFPFEIYVQSQSLYFDRSDGDNISSINGIVTSSAGSSSLHSPAHILCQKTGSLMEIYYNGTKIASGSDNSIKQTQNQANLYIGSKGNQSTKDANDKKSIFRHFNGKLTCINIWNEALNNIEIINVSESINGSPYIGNIFYKNGFAVITHPKYFNTFGGGLGDDSISSNFTVQGSGSTHPSELQQIKFQGSHLIYEHEFQCTVDEDDFNLTNNISARKIRSSNSAELANFATGSLFKPYVTTIGLYDENQELLVVGKLAQPIRTSNETDTTFIVKWDT